MVVAAIQANQIETKDFKTTFAAEIGDGERHTIAIDAEWDSSIRPSLILGYALVVDTKYKFVVLNDAIRDNSIKDKKGEKLEVPKEIVERIEKHCQAKDYILLWMPFIKMSCYDYVPIIGFANFSYNVSIEKERVLWWTFAGGQINHTLKYGIQVSKDWKIVADNFKLKIEGSGITSQSLKQIIVDLCSDGFWKDSLTQSYIKANIPNYRLSKFQSALPTNNSFEIVENYLLDISKTTSFTKNFL